MKILAYTAPARGHLFPIVPVLDELAARGHEIALRTLASEVPAMRDRGFDADAVAADVAAVEHDDYRARTAPGRLRRAMATFAARAPLEIEDVSRALDRHRPDAMLIDCMAWGGSAAAERHGAPWAQWFPYPMPLSSPEVPPFGPGMAPAAGPLGRLRDRMLTPIFKATAARAMLPGVNGARRAAGLDPFADVDEIFRWPPLTLYMTAEPLEYTRSDWPASVRMVGPCSWDPPSEPPAWLEEIDRPVVLVSTSSEFQGDGLLVRRALDALAGEDVIVVATLPAADLRGEIPENAQVERFVPHSHVLGRAVCAITHGGAGVTQKALAAGVPVCVVPFGRDQLEVARRVEVAGAGTRLAPARMTAERLRVRVREATACREGALRVAAGFEATGGPRAAADHFEQLAAARLAPR